MEKRVLAKADCGMNPVVFMLEGPVGDDAYTQSKRIAALLKEEVELKFHTKGE